MSVHSKRHLIEQIAGDLLSNGVSSVGRWNVLRVYGRERFTDGLYEELVEGVNDALEGYAQVSRIMTTEHNNNAHLVFLPRHVSRVYPKKGRKS